MNNGNVAFSVLFIVIVFCRTQIAYKNFWKHISLASIYIPGYTILMKNNNLTKLKIIHELLQQLILYLKTNQVYSEAVPYLETTLEIIKELIDTAYDHKKVLSVIKSIKPVIKTDPTWTPPVKPPSKNKPGKYQVPAWYTKLEALHDELFNEIELFLNTATLK